MGRCLHCVRDVSVLRVFHAAFECDVRCVRLHAGLLVCLLRSAVFRREEAADAGSAEADLQEAGLHNSVPERPAVLPDHLLRLARRASAVSPGQERGVLRHHDCHSGALLHAVQHLYSDAEQETCNPPALHGLLCLHTRRFRRRNLFAKHPLANRRTILPHVLLLCLPNAITIHSHITCRWHLQSHFCNHFDLRFYVILLLLIHIYTYL